MLRNKVDIKAKVKKKQQVEIDSQLTKYIMVKVECFDGVWMLLRILLKVVFDELILILMIGLSVIFVIH